MTDDELSRVIAENVRAARLSRGMTQASLGAATGIAVPHISRLEKGERLPSVATLKKVADALGVPICSLIDRSTDGPARPRKKK